MTALRTDDVSHEQVATVGALIERPISFGEVTVTHPSDVLVVAANIAKPLAQIIEDRKLYVVIKNRRFVYCEGWTTLGAMLGAMPQEVDTVESATTKGEFISKVNVVCRRDGTIIGSASASCGPDEKDWAGRSRQARRSMAQTRATGKAMRLLFSWVMQLAGYEITPAEEIEGEVLIAHVNPTPNVNAPKAAPRGERDNPENRPIAAAELEKLAGVWMRMSEVRSDWPPDRESQFSLFKGWVADTVGRVIAKTADWTRADLNACYLEIDRMEGRP